MKTVSLATPEEFEQTVTQAAAEILDSRLGTIEKPRIENSKPRGFDLTPIQQFLVEEDDECEWLADRLLPAGGLVGLVGRPKTGKTTIARDLVYTVSRGFPFLGRPTRKGRVAALFLEEKRSQAREQFRRMALSGDEEIFLFFGAAPDPAMPWLTATVEKYRPALVIVDPLARLLRVKDLNDYASVTAALEPLNELARNSGATIIFVHHQSKGDKTDGESVLGSTAIFGAVDTLLLTSRRDTGRTVKSMQRYGEDLEELVIELDADSGLVSIGGTAEARRADEMKARVLRALADADRITEQELKDRVGGNTTEVAKALRQAIDANQVHRGGRGHRGNPYIYSLRPIVDSQFPLSGESRIENSEVVE